MASNVSNNTSFTLQFELGARQDSAAIGFYSSGMHGTFYSQGGRNGGKPRFLFYRGTGLHSGVAWIGIETGAFENEDDDFDDTVLLVETSFFGVTPVQQVPWAVLKSRFR